jgi:hypothetical protein
MTLDEFVTTYNGKKVDFDKQYGNQCVDLFRQYVKDVLKTPQPKGVIGAKEFWSNRTSDPVLISYYTPYVNTPEFIPLAGDVVIWGPTNYNEYGHVAIFLEGGVNSFKSFDQNYPTLYHPCAVTTHSYKDVLGVLRHG